MQMMLNDHKLLAFLLVVAFSAVAYFDNQNASGMGDSTQAKNAASNRLVWLDNYFRSFCFFRNLSSPPMG